jgi:hypothetical protein
MVPTVQENAQSQTLSSLDSMKDERVQNLALHSVGNAPSTTSISKRSSQLKKKSLLIEDPCAQAMKTWAQSKSLEAASHY